jgi:hydroxylaminobenzene mutase
MMTDQGTNQLDSEGSRISMNPIPQQLLVYGTVLFLISLLSGFAMPLLANPRMGVSAHVAGLQSGMMLWIMGLMWHRLSLSDFSQRFLEIVAIVGLYAIFVSLFLAALWGTSRATPIAGAGHQASHLHEIAVTLLLTSGSVASAVAAAMLLWGLCRWKP